MSTDGADAFPQVVELALTGVAQPTPFSARLRVEGVQSVTRIECALRVRLESAVPPLPGLTPGWLFCLRVTRQPASRRNDALWQSAIRKAAGFALGHESSVPAVFGTAFDTAAGLAAVLEEYVEARPWRLETDRYVLSRPKPGPDPDYREPVSFPSEYVAWRFFLARFAKVLRAVGADALARRYEWSSWRSQRRVAKRMDSPHDPAAGLVALDFRGVRGDPARLAAFAARHPSVFADSSAILDPLAGGGPAEASPPGGLLPRLWTQAHRVRAEERRAGNQRLSRMEKMLLPIRLLVNRDARTSWLLQIVDAAEEDGGLAGEEADRIRAQANDDHIQTYLKCLAVHLCMLPTTWIVVLIGGLWYSLAQDLSVREGMNLVLASIAFFAVFPASPGSILRGLYVVGVMIWRREVKPFRVALVFSFWRYVGFAGFPLQMVARFPALARFLAARWATQAVHAIPVYGKPGNLLEHRVFDLFFNLPLTLARRRR